MKKHFTKKTKATDIVVSVYCLPRKYRELNKFNGVIGVFLKSDDPWEDAQIIAKGMKLKQTKVGKQQEKKDVAGFFAKVREAMK